MLSPSISIVLKDTVFDETEGSYSMRILVPISSPRRQISLFTASPDSRDADWSCGPTRRYKIFHSMGQFASLQNGPVVTVSQIEGIELRFNPVLSPPLWRRSSESTKCFGEVSL